MTMFTRFIQFIGVIHRYQELAPDKKWCVVCGESYADGDHY